MRFRDRRHQLAVQAAERNDPVAQAVIAEFCNLINFPYQQQQGLFAVGFYNAVLPASPARGHAEQDAQEAADAKQSAAAAAAGAAPLAASQDEAADSAVSAVGSPAGDLATEEIPSADELPAPALHAEEPLFAEGTEGIIAAAEQLSDEQLDAGGDAAVASAIAGAATGPGAEPSSNGSADYSEESVRPELAPRQLSNAEPSPAEPLHAEPSHAEPSHVDAVHPEASPADTLQAGQSQAGQPQGSNGDAAELGDDLDLSSLLDPYLGDNGLDNGHEIANGGAHRVWGDELAHGDVAHDEPVPVKDVPLGGESEHDRNHVSQ
jgi:hypothetical protein